MEMCLGLSLPSFFMTTSIVGKVLCTHTFYKEPIVPEVIYKTDPADHQYLKCCLQYTTGRKNPARTFIPPFQYSLLLLNAGY